MDRRIAIILGATFLAYALASLLWSSDPWWGGAYWLCLALGIPLGLLPQRRVWAWAVGLLCTCLFFDWFSFDLWPYAPFLNPNALGCAIALALAAALAYQLIPWFTVPVLVAGLFYAGSRGAFVGAAFAAIAWTWRFWRTGAVAVALTCVAYVAIFGVGGTSSFAQRLGIWHDVSTHLSLFGVGLGSFWDAYWAFPVHINNELGAHAPHAYNDFLELIFTFGIGTIPLWFFLAYVLPASTSEARLIGGTFIVLGLSFFPTFIFPLNTLLAATLVRALMENPNGSLATRGTALHQRPRYGMGIQRG